MFAHFPQTRQIYFGGTHDNGYATLLRSLDTEGLLSKITLLRSYNWMAADIRAMKLPSIIIDRGFREEELPNSRSSTEPGGRYEYLNDYRDDRDRERPSSTYTPSLRLPPIPDYAYRSSSSSLTTTSDCLLEATRTWENARDQNRLARRMRYEERTVSPSEISLPDTDKEEEEDWFEENHKKSANAGVRTLFRFHRRAIL